MIYHIESTVHSLTNEILSINYKPYLQNNDIFTYFLQGYIINEYLINRKRFKELHNYGNSKKGKIKLGIVNPSFEINTNTVYIGYQLELCLSEQFRQKYPIITTNSFLHFNIFPLVYHELVHWIDYQIYEEEEHSKKINEYFLSRETNALIHELYALYYLFDYNNYSLKDVIFWSYYIYQKLKFLYLIDKQYYHKWIKKLIRRFYKEDIIIPKLFKDIINIDRIIKNEIKYLC